MNPCQPPVNPLAHLVVDSGLVWTVPIPTAIEQNCWLWVQYRLQSAPKNTNFKYTMRTPKVGDIAVFFYEKPELMHYAVVEEVSEDSITISECNMQKLYGEHCGRRTIQNTYSHLLGFVQ